MPVASSDFALRKPAIVSDASTNGGRLGSTNVVFGYFNGLFPMVTVAERTAGVTRYRKVMPWNMNASDEIAYGVMAYLMSPSNAGDRFYLGIGSQTDIQNDLTGKSWFGVGSLQTALTAGVSTSVVVAMENNDFLFPNGGYLHVTDKFMASQTMDTSVTIQVGDSVEWNAGLSKWQKISATEDTTYPVGLYLGGNLVLTDRVGTSNEEWLLLADNHYTAESIGSGTGANLTPTLSTLAHKTNGVCAQTGKLPVITATCGAVTRTVNVAYNGACSGYCSAGQLNMATGAWTTPITWASAPDNGTSIYADYRENCWSWSGNNATVALESGITPINSYATANTYAGGCVDLGNLATSSASWLETNANGGTYNETTYPLVLYNDGTVYDSWTITFTGSGTFVCSGANVGSVGSGSTSSNFSPTNPATNQPYFTLNKNGFAGTWTTGDMITFVTNPSAGAVWLKEVVPAGASAESYNMATFGMMWS